MEPRTTTLQRARGFRTQDPSSNEVKKRFELLSPAAVESALFKAEEAFIRWSTTSYEDRALAVMRAAELFEEQADYLANIASEEMGKPISELKGEILGCAKILRYYATNGKALSNSRELKNEDGVRAVLQTVPLGPILGIMPWNFPYYQVIRFVAPNLILGNTVLLKHAEICPGTALAIEAVFEAAGCGDGVYQNLFIDHSQIADVIADSRVHGVSLTGSEKAGAAVAEVAGRHLKKVVLELGGSDAHIYLEVDDVREAARAAVARRMRTMGQSCTSNKRIIIVDDIFEEFRDEVVKAVTELVPGDPHNPAEGSYYPLSSVAAVETLTAQIEDAIDKGAVLHVGGKRLKRPGAWMQPTVITGVTSRMRAYREELFGPVLVLYRVANEEEAIELANDSDFGLGGAIFTQDSTQAKRVEEQMKVGMTFINSLGAAAPDLPFGGIKNSGIGRELSYFGIDEFSNKKVVYENTFPYRQ